MPRIHGRLAPSRLALIAAAALGASPALAATTTVTIPAGTTQTTAVTASPAAGDTIIVDIDGTLRPASATSLTGVVVQGSGAGAVNVIVDGRLQGRLNLPSATGPISVTINSGDNAATQGWHTTGVTTFGSGADVLSTTADGTIAIQAATTFNFGAGTDTFNNAGRLIVGRLAKGAGLTQWNATLSLTNLEAFNNSGLIVMGSFFGDDDDDGNLSDGQVDDRLIATGVAFTGSGDSRIVFDVHLGDVTKANCGAVGVADCVDFTGGSTAGSTLVTINNARLSTNELDLGAGRFNDGITLIVGSSAASHFSLDPSSAGYVEASFGPAIEVGPVAYQLVYDSVGKRHMLAASMPSNGAAQAVTITGAGQEIWHDTTGSWFTRQADLRATPGGLQASNGLWGRLATSVSERDSAVGAASDDVSGEYFTEARQRTTQLTFGGDVLRGAAGDHAWVVGVMLGALRSDAEYDLTESELTYTGFTGGVYGSYLAGPLFVDVVVNGNVLDVEAEVPSLLASDLDHLATQIKSVGGQVEAGWRMPVAANMTVEPLLAVSYVQSRLSEMEVGSPDVYVDFETAKSLRYGAGLRGAYDTQLMGLSALFSLTGRYWQENEGENAATLVMPTGEASLADELPGSFTEIDAGLNLFSANGGVSGFVNVGGKFGDDYEAVDGAVGVRLRW